LVKYKPCAGTEKPLSLFLLSIIAEKSSNVILCNPMLTKVPTMAHHIAQKTIGRNGKIKLPLSRFNTQR
jgi:hypothetical protein